MIEKKKGSIVESKLFYRIVMKILRPENQGYIFIERSNESTNKARGLLLAKYVDVKALTCAVKESEWYV